MKEWWTTWYRLIYARIIYVMLYMVQDDIVMHYLVQDDRVMHYLVKDDRGMHYLVQDDTEMHYLVQDPEECTTVYGTGWQCEALYSTVYSMTQDDRVVHVRRTVQYMVQGDRESTVWCTVWPRNVRGQDTIHWLMIFDTEMMYSIRWKKRSKCWIEVTQRWAVWCRMTRMISCLFRMRI